MHSNTGSYLLSSTRPSVHFTEPIISALNFKSPSPSRASLVKYSLCNLNRNSDKQHRLTPLPVLTTLVSPWYRCSLTQWPMYSFLNSLLSGQSTQFPFGICKNLVHFTQSNIFYHSMNHAHSSSDISSVRSYVLSIPVAFMVTLPLLNPNWSPPSTSSVLRVCVRTLKYVVFNEHASY